MCLAETSRLRRPGGPHHVWMCGLKRFPESSSTRLPFMPPPPLRERQPLTSKLSAVLVLLGISVFMNYMDRGNLSIAAPMLKDELGMSASQPGILISAFFWIVLGIAAWMTRYDEGRRIDVANRPLHK